MIAKDTSEVLRGWIHDFFRTTWASFVELTVLLLVSAWCWFAAAPSIASERTVPRPLDWYRSQVEAVGWRFPNWLGAVADWHVPAGLWWPLTAVVGAAVMCTLAATTAAAPGYRIAAIALLFLSMQWFGPASTLRSYVGVVALVAAAALVRCWIDHRTQPGEDAPFTYSPHFVVRGLLNGPAYVLIAPVALPIAAGAYAVRAFAFDNALMHDAADVRTVTEAIDTASREPGSIATMSAQDLAIALTAAQLAGRSNEQNRANIARRIHFRHLAFVVGSARPFAAESLARANRSRSIGDIA